MRRGMEELCPGNILRIERPIYNQEQVNQEGNYTKPSKKRIKELLTSCRSCNPLTAIGNVLPVVRWLREYKWKKDIAGDIVSGFTVAVMHIPQGMAYALLGNVSPIFGIYMAFFPVLTYFFFGTSRHNSMGTFAIVCLMTGKVVLKLADPIYLDDKGTAVNSTTVTGYTPAQVATAVTFAVAVFQCAMYVFRLGIISMLLSESLVSGFVTGAAVQVFTSQVKDLLGLTIDKITGKFEVIYTYISIFENITTTNLAALVISVVAIIILVINNEILKPRVAKLCSFPIPIEIIAVISGTLLSTFLNLKETYNISTVGYIPQGIPEPTPPVVSLFTSLAVDAIMIAVVSYALTLSMGLIFAQKLHYEIDANQELLALGVGNFVGSFFSCMPYCASISRSFIQQTVGGKSQIASIVSCGILCCILIWIGPFFQPLPKAVLASIIVVALKGMLMNVKDFFRFLRLSKMDAAVWLVTFLTSVIVSIDVGLLTGFCISLLTVLVMSLKPYVCLLGSLPNTDLYLDVNRYKTVHEIPGLKLFHYRGGINFASRNIFRSELYKTLGVNPTKELIKRKKMEKYESLITIASNSTDKKNKLNKLKSKMITGFSCLILDFSAVSYVDPSGVSTITQIAEEFGKIDIPLYIAGCSGPVYEIMKKCNFVNDKKSTIKMFPTVHDAVQHTTGLFDVTNSQEVSTIKL